jgi:putative phosphoesterase
VQVVVLADTHLRSGIERLPRAVLEAAASADVVLHAGDVVSERAWRELGDLAPLHAVLGNNDHELVGLLPEELGIELAGVRVAMVHDAGPAPGRARRMLRRFPDASIVVFGHSHIPMNEPTVDGPWLFNPGSPTQRRRQPRPTFGRFVLHEGAVLETAVVPCD